MQPLLADHGVRIVAISTDDPTRAAAHIERDELPFEVLADPDADTLRAFGAAIRHMSYLTFGIRHLPVGIPTGFRTMAIPTSVLIDEHGVVRWIDAAEDYRLRSDNERIRQALSAVFG